MQLYKLHKGCHMKFQQKVQICANTTLIKSVMHAQIQRKNETSMMPFIILFYLSL